MRFRGKEMKNNQRRGFSLLEILVTLGVMSMLFVMAYTQLFKTAEKTAREIDLTEARSSARVALEMMRKDLANLGLNVRQGVHQPNIFRADAAQIIFSADLDKDLRFDDPKKRGALCFKSLPYDETHDPVNNDRYSIVKKYFSLMNTSFFIPATNIVDWGNCTTSQDPDGAEIVRYSLDYTGTIPGPMNYFGFSASDLEDRFPTNPRQVWHGLFDERIRHTQNPYDFLLIKEVWGTQRTSAGTLVHTYSGPQIITGNIRGYIPGVNDPSIPGVTGDKLKYPNNSQPYPLFTYKGDFNNAPGVDLWGDRNGDLALDDWEINRIYTNSDFYSLPHEDLNDNGVYESLEPDNGNSRFDTFYDIKEVLVSLTTETGDPSPEYPNERRSTSANPYPYHEVFDQLGVTLNNVRVNPPTVAATQTITMTPTITDTPTPYVSPTPSPTVTPSPTITLTATPSPAIPTPTFQIGTPSSRAEVAVGAFLPSRQTDTVRVWALDDETGGRLEPPITLLSDITSHRINGTVKSINTENLFGFLSYDNFQDVLVLTSGSNDLTAPNLFIFSNRNSPSTSLSYEFQDSVRADSLFSRTDFDFIDIVCAFPVQKPLSLFYDSAIGVAINTQLSGEYTGHIIIYSNQALVPAFFRFGGLISSLTTTVPGKITKIETANIDNYPPNPYGYPIPYKDDLFVFVEPNIPGDPSLYILTTTSINTYTIKAAIALEDNQIPISIDMGDFVRLNSQPASKNYLDFIVATDQGKLLIYQNNWDRNDLPPGNPGSPTLYYTYEVDKPVYNVVCADFYSPNFYADFAAIARTYPNMPRKNALFFRRGDVNIQLLSEIELPGDPIFCVPGITNKTPLVNCIVAGSTPDPNENRNVLYILSQQFADHQMVYEPTAYPPRRIPGPGAIRAARFTQQNGGYAPPDKSQGSTAEKSYLDFLKKYQANKKQSDNMSIEEYQNYTYLQ